MAHLRTVHIDVPSISTHRRAKSTEDLSRRNRKQLFFSRSLTWISSRVHSSASPSPFRVVTVQFKPKSSKSSKKNKQFLCWKSSSSKDLNNSEHSDIKELQQESPEQHQLVIQKEAEGGKQPKEPISAISHSPLLPRTGTNTDYHFRRLSKQRNTLLKPRQNTTVRELKELKEDFNSFKDCKPLNEAETHFGQINSNRKLGETQASESDIIKEVRSEQSETGTNGLRSFGKLHHKSQYTEPSTIENVFTTPQREDFPQRNDTSQVFCLPKNINSSQTDGSSCCFYQNQVKEKDCLSHSKNTKMDFYPQNLVESKVMISGLQESLFREKKITESQERTICNMKHEIHILDNELMEKNKECMRLSDQFNNALCKLNSLESKNNVLNNQVRMYEESNKRIYKGNVEIRSKLREKDAKIEELNMQR